MDTKIFGIDQDAFIVPNQIDRALSTLRSSGYYVNNNCRFELFKKRYLSGYLESIQSKNFELEKSIEDELLQGYKDYWELQYIADSRNILDCTDSTIRKEIESIFNGALIESSSDTKPWNYQFQYLLSSIFERSGFNVLLKEPDFEFEYNGRAYSVAAKRLGSKNSIGRNIKEAESQISKTTNYGFVALSLDKFYKNQNEVHVFRDPDAAIRLANEIIEHIIRSNLRSNFFTDRTSQILGVIAHIAFPFKLQTPKPLFELGYAAYTVFLPINPADSPEWNEVIEIQNRLKSISINF